MRMLVCGGSGYIGARLVEVARCRGFEVIATSTTGAGETAMLDLSRPEAFDLSCISGGDLIVLAAAISSPDVCANDRPRAWGVNVEGTGRFVERALERGARVAFLSSDTVYGQRPEAFDETVPCNPAGDYAAMKHEVEARFAGHSGFKALRLSYVFSRDDKFTRYLASCHAKSEPAEIFDPFVRCVVYREDVVDTILALARDWGLCTCPVLNVGGPEAISRVDFAGQFRRHVWPELRFQVVTPGDAFFLNRPRHINMTSAHLAGVLGRQPHGIATAIAFEFGTQDKPND